MIAATAPTSNIHVEVDHDLYISCEVDDMYILVGSDGEDSNGEIWQSSVRIESEFIAFATGRTALQAMKRAYRAALAYRAAFC